VVDAQGAHTFGALSDASARCAATLLGGGEDGDLREARIALIAPPGFEFLAALLGIWRAGGIAVPLAVSHPPPELEYVMRDADVRDVVTSREFDDVVAPIAARSGIAVRRLSTVFDAASRPLPDVSPNRRALILYTSGTTAKPKGVVTTHDWIAAQIDTLTTAWGWRGDDRALLALPLHHVHGLINVVCCAVAAGATCEMLPRFDAGVVWERLASGEITVFSAVPTMYHRLIAEWERAPELQASRSAGARRARLMMSGSAALPPSILGRWRDITGHTLLERYGMTEIGMALSNPLDGERRPGAVGSPLPGVDLRLVDDRGGDIESGAPGQIEVRGRGVFLEYWRRPDATRDAFRDGWFRTGDVAVREDGVYRLLGRAGVDIIKTGGFKVSALEIEDALREHPAVGECAVVAVPDDEWGERVCAAVELRAGGALTIGELQGWAKARLAPYKIPRDLRCVPSLPRNAMGKVIKPQIASWFRASDS
jgi:malonyl-CoA/methylmalonyl-CoA synthetase